MICAICLPPLSLEDVLTKCVLLSYSQAWQLGRAILRTRALGGISIVDAIAKQQKGVVLIIGKVKCFKGYLILKYLSINSLVVNFSIYVMSFLCRLLMCVETQLEGLLIVLL